MSGLNELAQSVRDRKPSLVEDAYRALKDAIRENRFPPGYQGSEQEIALRLGMSRTPVHEAIIRLQEDGLIKVLPKRGVVVSAISPADMREIYDVVIALEGMSAELLASQPAPSRNVVSGELTQINVTMEKALKHDDLVGWAKGDEEFHRLLVERSRNGRIQRITQNISDQSHRSRMFTLKLRPKPIASVIEHRNIIKAIRSGDAAEAAARACAHRKRARDALLPLLDKFGVMHL